MANPSLPLNCPHGLWMTPSQNFSESISSQKLLWSRMFLYILFYADPFYLIISELYLRNGKCGKRSKNSPINPSWDWASLTMAPFTNFPTCQFQTCLFQQESTHYSVLAHALTFLAWFGFISKKKYFLPRIIGSIHA